MRSRTSPTSGRDFARQVAWTGPYGGVYRDTFKISAGYLLSQASRQAMTDHDSARCEHSEQSRYYRDMAMAIRARLPTLQDDEVFNELYLLAAHYERLADFADSSGALVERGP